MSAAPEDLYHEIHEVLWGGPRNQGKGLVYVVEQNSRAIEKLQHLLHGPGDKANGGGLVDAVRLNREFRERLEGRINWVIGIALAGAVGWFGRLVWWAVQQMASP